MNNQEILKKIKGGLIVSCQALDTEPLYSSYIMGRMALAAEEGGAKGIRANTVIDIEEIKRNTSLPIIGIIKQVYEDSPVYITPTIKEVDALVNVGAEIIAIDATDRPRPRGESLEDFFKAIRTKYPNQLFMADCSCFSDCNHAAEIGFDLVGTTLCGYTESTKGTQVPSYELLQKITTELNVPIIAEGGIWERDELKKVFEFDIHAAVVGTAITRPRDITRRFVEAIN